MASRSKFIPLENDTEGLGCADSSGPLGFLFALVTPLWRQQKMIRQHAPKRGAVTLPIGWSDGASPVDSPRRCFGIGDQGLAPLGARARVKALLRIVHNL